MACETSSFLFLKHLILAVEQKQLGTVLSSILILSFIPVPWLSNLLMVDISVVSSA